MKTISPQALTELYQSGRAVELIDVRTPMEFEEAHVAFAKNIPLDQLTPKELMAVLGDGNEPVYFICRSGSRGKNACTQLEKAGFSNAVNVEGGMISCEGQGLPILRGRRTMSLERQVRIAAGSLVLLGIALSFLNAAFLALSAFIGAGLIFSGVTDTCGMGIILSRMPWNCTDSCNKCDR